MVSSRNRQYIVEHMVVPMEDVFSHTAYGHPWVTHYWLFDVMLYLAYYLGDFSGMIIFKALLITTCFGTLAVFLTKRGFNPYIIVIVILVASTIARERFMVRPELVTFLFVAVYFCLLESFKNDRQKPLLSHRYLWALPLIMLLWANSHAGAIFGLILIGIYATGEGMQLISIFLKVRIFDRQKMLSDQALDIQKIESLERMKTLILIFFITFLVGFLNPNTYHVYTFPYTTLNVSASIGLDIEEYAPPVWAMDYLFFIVLSLSVGLMILNIKKVAYSHLILFAFFSFTALRFNRNIALWAVIVVPLLTEYLHLTIKKLTDIVRPKGLTNSFLREVVWVLLTLVVVISSVQPFIKSEIKGGGWGLGLKKNHYPEKAVRFVEEAVLKGNMYNTLDFGGYLIWRTYPERKVFVDGRLDVFEEVLIDQLILTQLGFEKLIRKYNIKYAIMSYYPDYVDYINPNPLFGRELALVYWDDVAMVYLLRTPENLDIIKKYEYKHVRPADSALMFTNLDSSDDLISELRRNIEGNSSGWRNRMLLRRVKAKLATLTPNMSP